MVDQFRLSGAWNFRDLGGLSTEDERKIKPGVMFRSSELCNLDDDGRLTLLELGITDVVDLRGSHEIAYNGADALPDGVTLHSTPIHDHSNDRSAPHEQPRKLTPAVAEAALEHAYSRFPVLEGAQTALAHTIRLVADSDGGVLVHCAAGKDRAGWIMAALLRAAGIRVDDILADYERSNEGIAPLRALVVARNGDLTQVSDKVLGVHEDFISAAWNVVDTDYGGFPNYLELIGVDADLLTRLRSRLLD
ncbi:tyrosine-protein phosphatase [Antrihabitans sp. YC2-6]|uniref:tyrosine-protein phosphatase n=1 Tax=Antrihabitans sp. YC2-6 TaxID=2799498 RepID=UPI0018F44EAC|nr:tyrosine-protein phosphatase [Antrihabitans sp. YC2-6]MBJ8348654.1 tyrosine-protein phosphatase [Antrihabitans sp. YC2-6]